ncbi:MAG: hypothetical protein JO321_05540 [Solirubrobacterales bacterium]|nr:hypothetical protein [Solirubrobacterales bacterium]
MADVPAAEAGLGSGITNVSQQIGGALGLAVLSTVAANHTKALLAAHRGLSTSLIGGYHLAFAAGAATLAAGIALAFVLLRRTSSRPELKLTDAGTPDHDEPALNTADLEKQAA